MELTNTHLILCIIAGIFCLIWGKLLEFHLKCKYPENYDE